MKKKVKSKLNIKQTSEKKSASNFRAKQVKIKVVGLGGGGCSIVFEMAQNTKGVSFVLADTDRRVFKKSRNRNNLKVFHFGESITSGMGTGMNPDLALKAAENEKEKITKIFAGQDLSIIVGALGGGVASGAGPLFAEIAKQQKNITLGIFTLPFDFEGEKKSRIAKKAFESLRENLSAVVLVPNEKIFQLVDRKTPLKKSLSFLNQIFACWLGDLIEVISKPSLINIDFADLSSILKGNGEDLFFGQALAKGPTRAEEIVKKIFHNPVLDKPSNVKRILFNISGGRDLAIKEVALISQAISSLNERAKIIFGISQSPQYNGAVKLTLLALSEIIKPQLNGINQKINLKKTSKEKAASVLKKKAVSAKKTLSQLSDHKVVKKANDKKSNRSKKQFVSEHPLARADSGERIRRSALEAKEAMEQSQEKEWASERNWEVPAFLRSRSKQ